MPKLNSEDLLKNIENRPIRDQGQIWDFILGGIDILYPDYSPLSDQRLFGQVLILLWVLYPEYDLGYLRERLLEILIKYRRQAHEKI